MCNTSIIKARWRQFLDNDSSRLFTACIAVFLWGLLAHAYGFLHLSLSHDALNEFFVTKGEMQYKVTLGRFMMPLYQYVFHGQLSLPWLSGVLSLCWLSVSVWLTTYIFHIKDKLCIILIAGVFTVNISVTALAATYIHDYDTNIFAVMLAVCAAFFWNRGGKAAWLCVPLLVMVLGCYQSMLSVMIALVMFVSVLSLLQGKKASGVVLKGLLAIGMMLAAGILYLLAVRLSCRIAKVELANSSNSLLNLFRSKGGLSQQLELVRLAYTFLINRFFRSLRRPEEMGLLHILLALPAAVALIHSVLKKGLPIVNKLLILVLIVLLPLGMNISCVASGMVHDLMLFAAWLIYLFVLLIVRWFASSSKAKKLTGLCGMITVLSLVLILFADVQTANAAYLKKDIESRSTLSIMNTVSSDIGRTDGYTPGTTGVVFVGMPRVSGSELFSNLSAITGLGGSLSVTYNGTLYSYIQVVLQTPILHARESIPQEFIDQMPAYPEAGYIQWYEDVLVVKLSD